MEDRKRDGVVYGGTAVLVDGEPRVLSNAVIRIENGIIRSIQADPAFQPTRFETSLNAAGCLVLPGLINLHTHAPMSLFRGISEDLPLERWLHEVIFPLEKKWVTKDFVYLGSLLACLEMLRSGTTLFQDMYYFEEEVARAADAVGLRTVCGPTVIDRPDDFGHAPFEAECDQFLDAVKPFSRVVPMIAPHAVYDTPPAMLERIQRYARDRSIRIHMHVSETQTEVDNCVKKFGKTPPAVLDGYGFWSLPTSVAHAVCLTNEDIEILGRNEIGIAHNPESNLKLGTKIAPVVELRAKGCPVGLGTDSNASNNNLDLFQEASTAAKLQSHRLGPGKLLAKDIVKMLTLEGAKVLGLETTLGSLEVGKRADLTILDVTKPHATPLYDAFSHIVFSASASDVKHVVVDGETILKDFAPTRVDEQAILDEVRGIAKKIANSL